MNVLPGRQRPSPPGPCEAIEGEERNGMPARRVLGFIIANNHSHDTLVSLLNRHTAPAMLRATREGPSGLLQPV